MLHLINFSSELSFRLRRRKRRRRRRKQMMRDKVLIFTSGMSFSSFFLLFFEGGASVLCGARGQHTQPGPSTCANPSRVQYTAVATLHRRLSICKMLLHWFICFWGNLAGSLFVMAIIFGCKPPSLVFCRATTAFFSFSVADYGPNPQLTAILEQMAESLLLPPTAMRSSPT